MAANCKSKPETLHPVFITEAKIHTKFGRTLEFSEKWGLDRMTRFRSIHQEKCRKQKIQGCNSGAMRKIGHTQCLCIKELSIMNTRVSTRLWLRSRAE